jgi:DNA recombination protein RmuC
MMVELVALVLAVVACALCGFGGWALAQREIGRLQSDLDRTRADLNSKTDELKEMIRRHDELEALCQGEAVSRARLEPEVDRAAELTLEVARQIVRIEELTAERSGFEKEAQRVPKLEETLSAVQSELALLKEDKARLETKLLEQAARHEEQISALTVLRGEIETNFKVIAADALRSNQESFVSMANETFEKHKLSADKDFEDRKTAVEKLVTPLQKSLETYHEEVKAIEAQRLANQGALSAELRNVVDVQNAVRLETAKLANALRAAPKTRGR